MKLICYPVSGELPDIRPAPATRDWMEATPQRFANRCLPLSIANAAGWEVLNRYAFTAIWDGGTGTQSIRIGHEEDVRPMAISHFGSGVLTFHVSGLFRTEPETQLWVGGSPNRVKDGIQPLTGVVETAWSPFSFTMNWKFTRPGKRVRFDEGEPICFVFPTSLRMLEATEPEFRTLDSDPELAANYRDWTRSRRSFIADLKEPGSPANEQKWQKSYHRGVKPDGGKAGDTHRTRLRLKKFSDRRDAKDG